MKPLKLHADNLIHYLVVNTGMKSDLLVEIPIELPDVTLSRLGAGAGLIKIRILVQSLKIGNSSGLVGGSLRLLINVRIPRN